MPRAPLRRRASNSNFGFNLSWWDRLFGTYLAQPAAGHERMTIGVSPRSDEIPLHSQRSAPALSAATTLRLARSLASREGGEVRMFLLGDAAACAHGGQKVP